MKANKLLITICILQAACQSVVTTVAPSSPTVESPTLTLTPTQTFLPTDTKVKVVTPTPNPNLGYWNEFQYDIRKWTSITYDDKKWTPKTYPIYTLAPLLSHNSIESCIIYYQEGRGLPSGWTYYETPVILGGYVIFHERVFLDENGQELFMELGGYYVNYPRNENKSQCKKDAERVVMTGMAGSWCRSGDCGYCPGSPRTRLKIGYLVKLANPQMSFPVTEPGGNDSVGKESDWYFPSKDFTLEELNQFKNYNIEVVGGPVCADDKAWWQLRNINNGIMGWDSDDHFIMQP